MPIIAPCKDCEKRHPGCHDHCEKFISWKAKSEERRSGIQKEKHKYQDILGVSVDRADRVKRRVRPSGKPLNAYKNR